MLVCECQLHFYCVQFTLWSCIMDSTSTSSSSWNKEERLRQSVKKREVRLHRKSAAKCETLEAETAEQRDARLERLRETQQERWAAETAEQREARQWHDRDRHSGHSVQTKMLNFHRQIALLSCSHCTTYNSLTLAPQCTAFP